MRCLGRAIAKKATVALLLLLGGFSFAGITDYVATFSTPGPDRYADGTVVADGECYALVWSPKGSTFAGFSADGTTVSSADCVVLAAPLAVNYVERALEALPDSPEVKRTKERVDAELKKGLSPDK